MKTGVGRFQVMATLQAARARLLGLPLVSAKSWGLNRAIYIAARKRGFREGKTGPTKPKKHAGTFAEYHLGTDKAYSVKAGGELLFTIGGEIQTSEDFQRQVVERFNGTFREAWNEAMEIVRRYDRAVLEDPDKFFGQVYRPRRDELAKKWSHAAKAASPEREKGVEGTAGRST
ncbi:MAG: hypothetical protein ACRDFT_10005 [bacterium]